MAAGLSVVSPKLAAVSRYGKHCQTPQRNLALAIYLPNTLCFTTYYAIASVWSVALLHGLWLWHAGRGGVGLLGTLKMVLEYLGMYENYTYIDTQSVCEGLLVLSLMCAQVVRRLLECLLVHRSSPNLR